MATHFLSYGNHVFANSIERIEREAVNMGIYESISCYRREDLDNIPSIKPHLNFIDSHKRGGGYWLWKHMLILEKLKAMPDGDVLQYTDAGCTLNVDGKEKLLYYISICDMLDTHVLGFDIGHMEGRWTKKDLFVLLDCEDLRETKQVIGTYFFVRKSEFTVMLFEMIVQASIQKDYHFITDSPSVFPNYPEFSEHRHDQSLFSCFAKKYGATILADESWNETIEGLTNITEDMKQQPIYSSRLKN